MNIHLAVDHGVNLSYRADERSSLGSTSVVPLSQQELARAAHQEAAWQVKQDPDKAPLQAPLNDDDEDAQMRAAMQQSLGEHAAASGSSESERAAYDFSASTLLPPRAAPMQRSTSLEDSQDVALQQALMESRNQASAAAAVSAIAPSSSSSLSLIHI